MVKIIKENWRTIYIVWAQHKSGQYYTMTAFATNESAKEEALRIANNQDPKNREWFASIQICDFLDDNNDREESEDDNDKR